MRHVQHVVALTQAFAACLTLDLCVRFRPLIEQTKAEGAVFQLSCVYDCFANQLTKLHIDV